MIGNQVLPDGLGIPATTESLLDQLAVRFADTGRGPRGTCCAPFFEKGAIKSGSPWPVLHPSRWSPRMAGFAGARRPHPGRHTTTPADFR